MNPADATRKQIEAYRRMTGEQRLKIALELYELSCQISREGIRGRYPEATFDVIEQKLRERRRAGYAVSAAAETTR